MPWGWVNEDNDQVAAQAAAEAAALRQRQAARPAIETPGFARSPVGRREGTATAVLDSLGKSVYDAGARPSRIWGALNTMQPGESLRDRPEVAEAVAATSLDLLGIPALTGAIPRHAAGIFGGRLAKTADHAKLAQAEQMASKGMSPTEIREATGWQQGVDGKWRFEIDDSGSVMRPGHVRGATMGDKFFHPQLYDAYPDLKDIGMLWGSPPRSGHYEPVRKGSADIERISLSQADDDPRKVALHELQHAVQEREGFARGGAPNEFTQQGEALTARGALSFRREMDKKPSHLSQAEKEAAVIQDYVDMGAPEWIASSQARGMARGGMTASERARLGDLVALYGLDKRVDPYTSKEIYKNLAGEVEARNVADRADWNMSRRRDVGPEFSQDVPDANQIVRFESGFTVGPTNRRAPFAMAPDALPMDEPSRAARAKEQGFTVDAFHGTNQPIDKFVKSRLGASTRSRSSKEGTFFTDNPALASEYAENAGKQTIAGVAKHERDVRAAKSAYERAEVLAQRTGRNEDWNKVNDALAKWEDLELGALRADPMTGQNVMPVKLRMTNPKVYDAEGGSPFALAAKEGAHLDELMRRARAAGHDGVVVKNFADNPTMASDTVATHYAVFDPKNIRSRFAAFDPKNEGKGFLLGANKPDARAAALIGATNQRPFGSLAPAAAEPQGIRAYHGSPHDFDRFDISKIGTGEGAQAYGHGLYFAEQEGVAKSYRDALAADPRNRMNQVLHQSGIPAMAERSEMVRSLRTYPELAPFADNPEVLDLMQKARGGLNRDGTYTPEGIRAFRQLDKLMPAPSGKMYEVDIRAKPEQFLDWDKPITAQPDPIQRLARNIPAVGGNSMRMGQLSSPIGEDIYRRLSLANLPGAQGKGFERVTNALREEGIPGIRYLDQGSRTPAALERRLGIARNDLRTAEKRGIGDPERIRQEIASIENQIRNHPITSNYVLFDDSLVNILRKYALPGSAGGAAFGFGGRNDQ